MPLTVCVTWAAGGAEGAARPQPRRRDRPASGARRPRSVRPLVLVAPASTSGLDFISDNAFGTLIHPTAADRRTLAEAAFQRPPPQSHFDEPMAVIERASSEHIEGAMRSMRTFDRRSELAGLRLPTLLVCGDRDRHVPLRNHLATHARIPRCRLQAYFDVGHVPFMEVPDVFALDVDRFLESLRRNDD